MNNKLIIIGGGPAGMAAALEASRNGIDACDIEILERDVSLGGILNQCIHAGFGLHLFGEELTGPEYAGRFEKQVREAGIGCRLNAMALDVSYDAESGSQTGSGSQIENSSGLTVTYVSPETGYVRERAAAVILSTGCRERTRGAIGIPGTRPAGVFTAGSAQRFVNLEGRMPGRRIVILGSGDIGLIMARRLTLEGAEVVCVCELMPYSSGLGRNIAQCLDDFGIPLRLSHTVTEIRGRERVEGVTVSRVDENRRPIAGSEEYIECDALLLSVGLIPENELAKGCGVLLDRVTGGAVVNQHTETSVKGVFACGNALQVHDLVDFVTKEAYASGKAAAEYILNGGRAEEKPDGGHICLTKPGEHVRYVVPQRLETGSLGSDTRLFFRVDNILRDVSVELSCGGMVVKSIRKRIVTPGEMENVALDAALREAVRDSDTLEVSIKTAASRQI